MKRWMVAIALVCTVVLACSWALADDAVEIPDGPQVKVGDCEYVLMGFGEYAKEFESSPQLNIPSGEGLVGYQLLMTPIGEMKEKATYHPNLVYEGGEIGCSQQVIDIGAVLVKPFSPEDLYQIDGTAVSGGGTVGVVYELEASVMPVEIVFYDGDHVEVFRIAVADLAPLSEAE